MACCSLWVAFFSDLNLNIDLNQMHKIFATLIGLLLCGTMAAQELRFAYVDVDSVMHALPSYAEAKSQLTILRSQYEREAQYNEQNFQRQFSEFLEGQKSFAEAILLKRQADLQLSMERGIAFRRECDVLLRAAEQELMQPIRQRISQRISQIGMERGYAFVLPCRPLYADPAQCEDITSLVISTLIAE